MTHFDEINLNFLDIETTGNNYKRDKVTEVYISKVRKGEVIDTFHSLINPERSIDPYITQLTGISNELLQDAPTFEEVAEDIFFFLNDELMIAHNARFDYSFLKHSLDELGLTLGLNYCCTVKISRLLYPEYRSHNLNSIIDRIHYQPGERHRARYDTDAIRTFFYKALQEHGEEKFLNAFNTAIKKSAVPPALLNIRMEDIPEAPGVYLFYGKESNPIYIGMSKNLRRRVYEHFYQDLTLIKDFNINQQLERIEFIPTAGTLGALLREALLVKKYQPLYNRQLRRKRELIKLESFTDSFGYVNLTTSRDYDHKMGDNSSLVGYYRSKIELKDKLDSLVKNFGLCPKLLGLEKRGGACFSYQLGYCKGACCGKVEPQEYNETLNAALSEIKIQEWPFDGAKTIEERGEDLFERFTFDKWCLIDSSANDEVFRECEQYKFDIDIYKILRKYL